MRRKAILIVLSAVGLMMAENYLSRGFLIAFEPSDSDFSELYSSSWLWRHGQNPYDPMLATATRQQLTGGSAPIFLVNVPTSLVLMAPLTLLTWGWAHLVFLTLGMIGLAVTAVSVLRIRGTLFWTMETAVVVVFLLSFSPFRIAFQWGNVVLLVLPLSILSIVLADASLDKRAGLVLGLAVCLKPQIGIWLLAYYLLRGRFKIIWSSLITGIVVGALIFLHPISFQFFFAFYRSNLHHWFAPGGAYGFTQGSVPSLLLRTQGIFYQLTRSIPASNWVAFILFISGAAAWAVLVWRSGNRIPPSLAISTLFALSFFSIYHSIPDESVLILLLCDVLPISLQHWTRVQKLISLLLFVLMLPERSIFEFFSHHLNRSITMSWWWDLFLVRHSAWLLLVLGIASLLRMRESQLESTLSSE